MILINEPSDFPGELIAKLTSLGKVFLAGEKYDPNSIKVVFIRLAFKIDTDFLSNFPNLSHVVSPTTGLNHIDEKETIRRGIKVLSLKGHTAFLENIRATAEHTLALTLALLRRVPTASNSVIDGHWNRYLFKGIEISGKNVFLIGYGRVGAQVAKLFKAFGAKVSAYDCIREKVPHHLYTPLAKGVKSADIVSIHITFSDENRNFVDRSLLEQMSADSILINTSRGELIDQRALIELIESKKIGGAALDVLSEEPHPLTNYLLDSLSSLKGRLIVTPHIAGYTSESIFQTENYVVMLLLNELMKRN